MVMRYLAPTKRDADALKKILRKEGFKKVRSVKTSDGYRIYADRK